MKKFLILIAILWWLPQSASAALTLGANTSDRISLGTPANMTDLGTNGVTILAWIYPTSLIANATVFAGRTEATNTSSNLQLRLSGTAGNIEMRLQRTVVRSFVTFDTPLAALNTWHFIAASLSNNASTTNIYHGTLTQAVAESVYGVRASGSGTVSADGGTGAALWGNRFLSSGNSSAFTGRLGIGMIVNRVMSFNEIRAWQYHPRVVAGTVNFIVFGANGVGVQTDYSGNRNTGTPTGATISGSVPLRSLFGL